MSFLTCLLNDLSDAFKPKQKEIIAVKNGIEVFNISDQIDVSK